MNDDVFLRVFIVIVPSSEMCTFRDRGLRSVAFYIKIVSQSKRYRNKEKELLAFAKQ